MKKISERLTALRALMKKHGLQAYIVPSSDEHADEYVPLWWLRRGWASGFTGSAGELVVTMKGAALWTDGRYFIQAERQLAGSGITLMKLGQPSTPDMPTWIARQTPTGAKIGIDPAVCTMTQFAKLKSGLEERQRKLASVQPNLIDLLWKDTPIDPANPVVVHPDKFAGESVASKLKRLRTAMRLAKANVHVLCALDSIAWLFNLRGTDVPCNPFFISFAIVTDKSAALYVDPRKVTPELRRALAGKATIRPYNEIDLGLRKLSKSRVLLDPATTNQSIANKIARSSEIVQAESPIVVMKAAKNKTELKGMRDAHVRDGVALARFFHWLNGTLGKKRLTEFTVGEQLEAFRAADPKYRGPSFDTIAGFGPNGAIVHYRADSKTALTLKKQGLFLLDSGGQYLDGTTDITRTIALGTPTAEQREAFTRVFKGMLALLEARFPAGSTDRYLDIIARSQLWAGGLDYNHGTGHGVGCYLGVHEGPQRFNPFRESSAKLVPGMVISNEPGYYKAGQYGIRTEFLMYVAPDTLLSAREKPMLKFEYLTVFPIDTKLLDRSLLSKFEIDWLNRYHADVRQLLAPHLTAGERKWLESATRKL